MVDTSRTRTDLLQNLFQDGQPANSITAQDMRDLIMSMTPRGGWADYNNAGAAIPLTANTWTTLTNDGAGSFTNLNHLPTGVTQLLNTSNGTFDFSQLEIGDVVHIRNDFTITQSVNRSLLEFRYQLGAGGGAYTLEKYVNRLDDGTGVTYRYSLDSHIIYMGDTNTKDNPVTMQVRLDGAGSVTNSGTFLQVIKG